MVHMPPETEGRFERAPRRQEWTQFCQNGSVFGLNGRLVGPHGVGPRFADVGPRRVGETRFAQDRPPTTQGPAWGLWGRCGTASGDHGAGAVPASPFCPLAGCAPASSALSWANRVPYAFRTRVKSLPASWPLTCVVNSVATFSNAPLPPARPN